jgi:hypothetical protein
MTSRAANFEAGLHLAHLKIGDHVEERVPMILALRVEHSLHFDVGLLLPLFDGRGKSNSSFVMPGIVMESLTAFFANHQISKIHPTFPAFLIRYWAGPRASAAQI